MPEVFTEAQKEKARWEMFREDVPRGLQPGNPYRPGNDYGKAGAKYPSMLYRAERIPPGLPGAGKFAVSCPDPRPYGFRSQDEWNAACQEAQLFTKSCQRIVNSEDDELLAKGQGWRNSPAEALALAEAERKEVGNIAGARNWEDRNISEAARAEVEKAEAEHFGHLGEIPEKPIVRRQKKATA